MTTMTNTDNLMLVLDRNSAVTSGVRSFGFSVNFGMNANAAACASSASVAAYAAAAATPAANSAMAMVAAAHVSDGWASPCTHTVGSKRTEVAKATGITAITRRTAIKPANTQAKKWLLRPSGVQEVGPG